MKVTRDHRCKLHLADRTPTGIRRAAVAGNPALDCRVVNRADAAPGAGRTCLPIEP